MGNETEARRRALWAKQDRQVRNRKPPRLADGRRLIRVFSEDGTDLPLWENSTDHEPRWRARGHELVRRLRTELHGVAEIRAEFVD
ncbi:hypothetical protein ACIQLK_05185 [Microbacterium sp. NPDC091382]|uniref:hypothetical protein n=1 Tax=Microbacterium sp. NPDC091382 TaxID=3364210 RepID=UPI0037F7A6C6